MANTIVKGKYKITITNCDTDVLFTDQMTDFASLGGAYIKKITFYPAAASDRMILRDGADDGVQIFDSAVAADTGDSRIEYFDEPYPLYNPKLDADGTGVVATAGCRLEIEWA